MFGTCTKIHVCQVVTWNMCYSATCLCTFVFSCYFSAPDTFQLARRVFPAKYIEGSRAKKLQYSQSSATLICSKGLYQTSLWHLNRFHLHLCTLISKQSDVCLFFFSSTLCVSRRALFLLNQLSLCHPWACAGSVITSSSLQKKAPARCASPNQTPSVSKIRASGMLFLSK